MLPRGTGFCESGAELPSLYSVYGNQQFHPDDSNLRLLMMQYCGM